MTMSDHDFRAKSSASNGLVRKLVLRAHAIFVGFAGLSGMIFDFAGAFFGYGPQGHVLEKAPHTAIGFVEAHGLALILAAILWRARPTRPLHWIGFSVALLLGASNLTFWQVFVVSDALAMGYLTTSLHALFAGLHFVLATAEERERH